MAALATRRALFGAAAVLAASPIVLPSVEAEAAVSQLEQLSVSAPPQGSSDEVYAAWNDRHGLPLATVEALPLTKDNAVIRARAVMALYDFDRSNLTDHRATADLRLMLQIVACLVEAN